MNMKQVCNRELCEHLTSAWDYMATIVNICQIVMGCEYTSVNILHTNMYMQ